MHSALLVIDVQNDYAPTGNFPLWRYAETRSAIIAAIAKARQRFWPVVLVQHIAVGPSSLFEKDSPGVQIDPEILSAASGSPVVTKHVADSFYETNLTQVLSERNVSRLVVCGMMTQNCVTHTLISRAAEGYDAFC